MPSPRALRDAVLLPMIMTMCVANYRVYGFHKIWKALHRSGEIIGRDQVARLMRELSIQGVRRGKQVRTTRPDGKADRHPDLVDRAFIADRPKALWVTDLTYVPTWAGVVYVCFTVDAFSRKIVRWIATTNMPTAMVLDALEMVRWSRGTTLEGLVCHSDAGSHGKDRVRAVTLADVSPYSSGSYGSREGHPSARERLPAPRNLAAARAPDVLVWQRRSTLVDGIPSVNESGSDQDLALCIRFTPEIVPLRLSYATS